MKSVNNNNKIFAFNNLQGIDTLYEKIKKIINNNNINSFSLSMYSFNLEELDLSYSSYIKLFNKISSKLANYLPPETELFQFDHNKIISFSKNKNNFDHINENFENEEFHLADKKISISPQTVAVNWPEDGKNFDDLIDKLTSRLKPQENKIKTPVLPTHPDSILINKKNDFIDKVEKVSTQLYLIAKNENIEIIKQKIVEDRTFQVRSVKEDNFELFYILKGKVACEEEDITLSRGDSISVTSGEQEKYFKTIEDTTLLYITSNPIFASDKKRIQDLLSLNARIEEKDIETLAHCDRLQELSRLTAIELDIEEKKLFNLGYASFLHDIGKAKVPESMLKKPEKLSKEEWELMKKHTEWGKEIILEHFNKQYFHRIAEIINQHHERWDGNGYPKGLKGDEILIEAQILSVVDAYDAMTYERPYQKAFTREEAIAEIKAEKGKQFSPKAVEAFLQAEKKYHKQKED